MRCLVLVVSAAAISAAAAAGASRVVGGNVIQVQQAPWTVYVQYQSGGTRFLCTGSIVDASHILTAAHCVYDDAGRLATPSQVTVRAGVSNFSSPLPTDQEQDRPVSLIRVHPGYVYAGRPTPDDVAVIALASPLDLSGPVVQAVALPTAGAAFPAGAAVGLAGFGRSSPTVQTSGPLSWMTATVDPQGVCGPGRGLTANNGITLCAANTGSAVCNGDSGSGLVTTTGTPVLVGVVSAGATGCETGSHATFTYTGAPEILQFVQGNDNPPTAPRETAATVLQVKWDPPLVVGNTLSCSTDGWAAPEPRFAYSFVNVVDGTVLQTGSRTEYLVPASAIGATIVCEVTASNDGGTVLEETDPTPAVKAAPQVRILKVGALDAARGHALKLRVSLQSPVGLWGKFAVCIVPPQTVAGRLCRSTVNADGSGGIVPFTFDFRVKATAPVGTSRLVISAVAGVSHATATAQLRISRS
jgi:hypothetical protein